MGSLRIVMLALMFVSQLITPAQKTPADPDPATGLIIGTVIDAVTGAPLAGVVVELNSMERNKALGLGAPVVNPAVVTGLDGRFMFSKLTQGEYWPTTDRSGYVAGGVGATRPGMTSTGVTLNRGEAKTDLLIRLWRSSAISGGVVDEAGAPLVGVDVTVERRSLRSGHLRFDPGAGSSLTDDRGMYRLSGLEPGDYIAFISIHQTTMPTSALEAMRKRSTEGDSRYRSTMPGMTVPGSANARQAGDYVLQTRGPAATPSDASGAPTFVYATTFYPGVTSLADATVLHVDAGTERLNVNFQLRPAKTIRVSGRLLGPDGPLALTWLSLAAAGSSARWQEFAVAATVTTMNGDFTLLNVPQGPYTLTTGQTSDVRSDQPAGPGLWAETRVIAGDEDIEDLRVTARPGLRVRGRLEFVGASAPPSATDISRTRVSVARVDGRTTDMDGSARINSDGTLTVFGCPAGRYFVRVSNVPPGWALAAATHDGADVSQTPLELSKDDVGNLVITFTDRHADVTGVLASETGIPDAATSAIVFPADRVIAVDEPMNPRRVRIARPSDTGAFVLRDLPPGDYFITALAADDDRWADPQFLQTLVPQAVRMHVDYDRPNNVTVVIRKEPVP